MASVLKEMRNMARKQSFTSECAEPTGSLAAWAARYGWHVSATQRRPAADGRAPWRRAPGQGWRLVFGASSRR